MVCFFVEPPNIKVRGAVPKFVRKIINIFLRWNFCGFIFISNLFLCGVSLPWVELYICNTVIFHDKEFLSFSLQKFICKVISLFYNWIFIDSYWYGFSKLFQFYNSGTVVIVSGSAIHSQLIIFRPSDTARTFSISCGVSWNHGSFMKR